MRAIIFDIPNSPCKVTQIETPKCKAGQVLIKLKAAALNHRDLWIKKGIYRDIKFPCIVGSDGAGIVEETGINVDKQWLHKEIIINPGLLWGDNPFSHQKKFNILGLPSQGTLAEYICIESSNIFLKPQGWNFEKAAALPLAGLTAYRALFSRGNLQAGEKILITGAGGGVSSFLIKFALAVDAKVFITSGNAQKIHKALEIGAINGVNYNDPEWDADLLRYAKEGFDIIVDSAGGENFTKLLGLLRIGGRIVIFGGTAGKIPAFNASQLFWKQASILGTTMGSPIDFKKMLHFVEQHDIEPQIDKVFEFENTEQAFQYMDGQNQFGKIVIKH
jgi:zinc-binding alcohol dehydrogenase/oxidoreductase